MSKRSTRQPANRVHTTFRASRRRWIQYGLLFLTAALVVNALIGERGLTALLRVRDESAQLRQALAAIRRENTALQDEITRLTSDPRAIEEAARRDLGLAKKDELLFIVRDVKPTP